MFEGVYSSYKEPICDFGAKRTLNMGGSLLGYIQTGNSYDKRYNRNTAQSDTFEKKKVSKKTIDKFITALTIGATAAAGGILLFKNLKPESFLKFKENIQSKIKFNPKEKIKFSPKEIFSNISEKFTKVKTDVSDFFKKKKVDKK